MPCPIKTIKIRRTAPIINLQHVESKHIEWNNIAITHMHKHICPIRILTLETEYPPALVLKRQLFNLEIGIPISPIIYSSGSPIIVEYSFSNVF